MEQNPAYKHSYISAYSSVVEQWPSKPSVSGSTPLKRSFKVFPPALESKK